MGLDDIDIYALDGTRLTHKNLLITNPQQQNGPPKPQRVEDAITNDSTTPEGANAMNVKDNTAGPVGITADAVELDGGGETVLKQVQSRHPKYVNSDKAMKAMEEAVNLIMMGKRMHGNMLKKQKLLHTQAHREYTAKEFKEMVRICVHFMWSWGRTHVDDMDQAVPSQKTLTKIGGAIIEKFGRRFKNSQKNVFVLKLIGRRNYDLREERRKAEEAGEERQPKKRHKSREGMGDTVLVGGHNPRLDPPQPVYDDEADEVLARSTCPTLVRDLDGIMQPEEDHSTDVTDYVRHFKNRRKGDNLSIQDLTVMCNTWCRGKS